MASSADGINTEHLLVGGVAAMFAVVAWNRRDSWLPAVGQWLQHHHIVARPGEGILELGTAGSIDGVRIALLLGALVVIATLTSLYRRARRARTVDNI